MGTYPLKMFTGFTKMEKNTSALKLLITSWVRETERQLTVKQDK